jgi:S1-C subfamily serine protease
MHSSLTISKILLLSGALTTTLAFYGCVSSPDDTNPSSEIYVPTETPIKVSQDALDTVTFSKVLIEIPPGTPIGRFTTEGIKGREIPYDGTGLEQGSPGMTLAALEELRNSGYRVLGGENLLFAQDESAKARYELGATIRRVYMIWHGGLIVAMSVGTSAETEMEIEWQVFDTRAHKVVLTETTKGYARAKDPSAKTTQDAFRASLRNLLAMQKFVDVLKKNKPAEIAVQTFEPLAITIAAPPPRQLPADLNKVLASVVTLKSGDTHATGFIISRDGYVLTAEHVVSGLDVIMVRLSSGLELEAKVVRSNPGTDDALIKLPGTGYEPLALALTASPAVGTEVYAIGTPLMEELNNSVSKGVVSAVRKLDSIDVIQTDANVNSGNSGGPLINTAGQAVGIISSKVAIPGFNGIAFAVPIVKLSDDLKLDLKTEPDKK